MADFDPPFSSVGGENRSPTTDEQSDGFQCGAADLTLFNRLFGRIEAELKAIQQAGGIAGTESDDTTVLQAINALISAATGGGDTSQFVLFTQAQTRLPIFPEVTTNDGVIAVTSPVAGTIRVPASATIMHRGIRPYTTAQEDFLTDVSKTYHLRWNPTDGFSMNDLASGTYNPTTALESNAAFDSDYDDVLISRIVTNSSNVAEITNLQNKALLSWSENQVKTDAISTSGAPGYNYTRAMAFAYNFARAPKHFSIAAALGANAAGTGIGIDGVANLVRSVVLTRYQTTFTIDTDFNGVISGPYVDATVSVMG